MITRTELIRRAEALRAKLNEREAERAGLRQSLTAAQERLADLLSTPAWAELDAGAEIAAGERVRYFARTYECVLPHAKSLTKRPGQNECWREVAQ